MKNLNCIKNIIQLNQNHSSEYFFKIFNINCKVIIFNKIYKITKLHIMLNQQLSSYAIKLVNTSFIKNLKLILISNQ